MKILNIFCLLFCLSGTASAAIETDTLSYAGFGKMTVYHPEGSPSSVALFVSGDGGWKDGVVTMAHSLAARGALVLGIDARRYSSHLSKLNSDCLYPAADFEQLSLAVQKKYKFSTYYKPVLVGYSFGAVLIYGILVQAPANTFKGALALGFSADIDLKKPLCKGNGLESKVLKAGKSYDLQPTNGLTAPFIVINGMKDQVCPYPATADFLKGMKNAELVGLPGVGHGFSHTGDWMPQLNTAYQKILHEADARSQKMVQELPLTFIPVVKNEHLPLVFMISGDGGWTSFDQSLAEALSAKGMNVIGLDAQKYFWNAKTPERTAADLCKAILYYRQQTDEQHFVLAGYSFGASVVPFVTSRLPAALKQDLKGVLCLSPDVTADFEIHVMDMLSLGGSRGQYDVIAEIKKTSNPATVSIFGSGEGNSIKRSYLNHGMKVITIPGDHHFDKNYELLSKEILNGLALKP
ncbi:probable acvb-related protein [Pedobacter sp. BAL39]|uniref:AcvB/VirJ family lysyl-phosphatidylglycerol hydrolase n=1 Tax=Pedobacter sp. BAL39 TaxID=391596 RepID=UPI000155940D|nr:AcvB/VirJ family lysyl-phosphatidylglycerol hydrolase [Pedobacter sp. BAL39]EDM36660.1 probable acvb-related protein [Pedobacter sp. BAL39]